MLSSTARLRNLSLSGPVKRKELQTDQVTTTPAKKLMMMGYGALVTRKVVEGKQEAALVTRKVVEVEIEGEGKEEAALVSREVVEVAIEGEGEGKEKDGYENSLLEGAQICREALTK